VFEQDQLGQQTSGTEEEEREQQVPERG